MAGFNWNHRVVRSSDGDLYLQEVSYSKDGTPFGYSNVFLAAESLDGLRTILQQLERALAQPILDADDLAGE
jgi:hypothetical protein